MQLNKSEIYTFTIKLSIAEHNKAMNLKTGTKTQNYNQKLIQPSKTQNPDSKNKQTFRTNQANQYNPITRKQDESKPRKSLSIIYTLSRRIRGHRD